MNDKTVFDSVLESLPESARHRSGLRAHTEETPEERRESMTSRRISWIALLLIAVGAAHLPGRVGILNLLADKGYTFARVY